MKTERKVETLGFINVDKPSGVTSSAIVNKIKRLTGLPCGHMGTLDPLASGVLPVGIGNAARLFDYFLAKEKEYIAEFTFGVTSDTLDSTGELFECGRVPEAEEIRAVLPDFCGDVLQVPPKYSAKNVNGRRGYELARAGVEFELAPKRVRIDEVTLLGAAEGREGAFCFKIRCGGGTYIRSLARDVAEKIGTAAVMSGLKRTQSGYFKIEDAVPPDWLTEENAESFIIPTERVLPFEKIVLHGAGREKIFNGVPAATDYPEGQYKIYREGVFYGIAEVKNGLARVRTKLC
ncbi:MAG: tRNA pseudouridine(55) synthase TruB [Firmicutes bacterium]|nr:tRNA pseudouridine(55) synthase TruB [Clostridia bacterium]MBS5022746.1 tRNA pseudouridine(55) synthase TruB [Bacillota bacterium]